MLFARPHLIALIIGAAAILSSSVIAQDAQQAAGQSDTAGPSLTPAQLDQLVAPVALYDDPLLIDILTAATYPLEVVEAHRWISIPANAALKGNDLSALLADQDWDPSVKALLPFPAILKVMDEHLDWTEHLGEAFLAQQADVMDAVQRLRHRAETAGTLKSSAQETVSSDGGDVTISPPPSDVIYVPAYDPWCVYGVWPYPVEPGYFGPGPVDCTPADYALLFDAGLFLPFAYWDWGYFDWRAHHVWINRDRYNHFNPDHVPTGNMWVHDPLHRAGVPYSDPRNVQQFRPAQNNSQSFRGYEGKDGASGENDRAAPPAFGNIGPGRDIQMQSQRGQMSRGGMSGGFGGGARSSGGGRGKP